jgi:hypothetical protein
VDQQHVIVPLLGLSQRPRAAAPASAESSITTMIIRRLAARFPAAIMNVDLLSLHEPMVASAGIGRS